MNWKLSSSGLTFITVYESFFILDVYVGCICDIAMRHRPICRQRNKLLIVIVIVVLYLRFEALIAIGR